MAVHTLFYCVSVCSAEAPLWLAATYAALLLAAIAKTCTDGRSIELMLSFALAQLLCPEVHGGPESRAGRPFAHIAYHSSSYAAFVDTLHGMSCVAMLGVSGAYLAVRGDASSVAACTWVLQQLQQQQQQQISATNSSIVAHQQSIWRTLLLIANCLAAGMKALLMYSFNGVKDCTKLVEIAVSCPAKTRVGMPRHAVRLSTHPTLD